VADHFINAIIEAIDRVSMKLNVTRLNSIKQLYLEL
jgi:hypothetical protein